MFPGEDGDRIGEHEWAVSDEEVEGSDFIAELIAAQCENFAGREPVDSDQQRCEAGIECDGAIRREDADDVFELLFGCLLYTSPSPRDGLLSRMPSSA